MPEKSWVTLEQHVCVVCGKTFDSGALLLDKRMREKFDMHTVTGWGMCPDHQKLKDDGYVALVGCKVPPSSKYGDNIQPEDADRTGALAHLRIEAWKNIMNVPVPDNQVCFCDEEVIEMLKSMAPPEDDDGG